MVIKGASSAPEMWPTTTKCTGEQDPLSGPGNYTATNGPKTPSVVFRVDVEDHGQGSQLTKSPYYRIRIWFVDPSTPDGLTLREAVACADPTTEAVLTALPPDVDDGGALATGNQQIHKPTGAKCKVGKK